MFNKPVKAVLLSVVGGCLIIVFNLIKEIELVTVPDVLVFGLLDAESMEAAGQTTGAGRTDDEGDVNSLATAAANLPGTGQPITLLPSSSPTVDVRSNSTCVLYRNEIIGGLGNRLWQVFSTLGMARQHSCGVLLMQPHFEMIGDIFDEKVMANFYPFQTTTDFSGKDTAISQKFVENSPHRYRSLRLPPEQERNQPVFVEVVGYLQNYRFATNSADEFVHQIRNSLSFQPNIVDQGDRLMYNMSRCSYDEEQIVTTWVGIHYRRFPDRHKIEPPPSVEATLNKTQALLDECALGQENAATQCHGNVSLSPCCALIVSNDPDWTKQTFSSLSCVRFVENDFLEDPFLPPDGKRHNGWASDFGRDMYILTMVDKLVITVGTFGYFSAILHDKDRSNGRHVYAYQNSNPVRARQHPSYWSLWE